MKEKKEKKVKKKKRRISKKVKFFLCILIVIIILFLYFTKGNNKTETTIKEVKVVDKIDNFEYSLNDKDTKLFKDTFKLLKEELSKDEIDNQKYAELVAQLFTIDFFTLDNKYTKNDIGGVQFVYSNYRASFIDKSRDEFYKYIKNNLNKDRNQELPIVESVTVESSEKIDVSDEIKLDELKDAEGYKIKLSINYKKDLGYQKTATLIVVKDDNKFAVAKLSE